ncbi:MAG: transposase [Promethearchaeota archaeon]
MEIYVNQILRQQFYALPAKYRRNLKKLGIVIIDFHDDPYYGTLTNPDIVRKGTKRSTQHFYSYLTADLYTPQGKQTIALRRQLPGERVADLFWDLFASLEAILTPKLILMDGEFAIYRILQPLTQMRIQFIVRKPLTKGLKPLALAYELTDDWGSVRKFHRIIIQDKHYKSQKMPVYITFQRVQGHAKILLVSSAFLQKPDVITNLYRIRFAIETGYRDKHQFQARTTSSHLSIRLMLFLFAILLWNLWQAFLLQVNSSTSYLLPRTNKWQRQLKTIKRFLLRDALL